MAHFGLSRRQYLTKKTYNTIATYTLANCPIRDPNKCQKTYSFNRAISLKF